MRKLDAPLARELFSLENGILIWLPRHRCARNDRAGLPAGSKRKDGYLHVQVFGKRYLVHRVVWLMSTGEWPTKQLDHVNRVRSDNRIENLRLATSLENAQNTKRNVRNKTGCKGVFKHSSGGFEAYITKGHKRHYLGYFKTYEVARDVRAKAQSEMFSFGGAL